MEKQEYRKHFELEESFWWFAGRRQIILNVLQAFKILENPTKILDVGCGTGMNIQFFEQYGGEVFGCDLSMDALNFCQQRGIGCTAQGNGLQLPFKGESMDLATLLDVLYHKDIKSDITALEETHRILKKGGWLLITDSAFKFLRSSHDVAFHTRERYTRKVLMSRLEAAGFEVCKLSYFNFFLFPLIVAVRVWEKRKVKSQDAVQSDLKPIHPALNTLLKGILLFEAKLIKRLQLPSGSSILCLAQKPE